MIKAAFFDIDDTLIRKTDGHLPKSTEDALTALHQAGIKTAIITGRSAGIVPKAVLDLMQRCHIDILSTANGQHTSFHGKTLSAHALPESDIRQFIEAADASGWAYLLHSGTELAVSRLDKTVMPAMYGVIPWYVNPSRWQEVPIYQFGFFSGDTKAIENAVKNLDLSEPYTPAVWHKDGCDLIPASGSKARAVRDICQALNIDPKDTIAFGDGHNDQEMLKTAGIGVAMGSGEDALKKTADYVTGRLEDGGIAQALKHFKLI